MIKLLKEKEWYEMQVLNRVSLPDDDDYFIIQDPFMQKHLFKVQNYEKYGLLSGKKVLCRVDKINCKGKIFFEPKHPYYQEGEIYFFKQRGGEISDILGNPCKLLSNVPNPLGQYKLIKIKKGICYLITA